MKNNILILGLLFLIISCKNDRPKANANFKFIYLENGGVSMKHTGIGYFPKWIVDDTITINQSDQNVVYYFKDNGIHKIKLMVYDPDAYVNSSITDEGVDTEEQTVEISGVPQRLKIEYINGFITKS